MASPSRTTSAEQTEALGAALAVDLRPGDVVLVAGDLGAGKTTFVRGGDLEGEDPGLLEDYLTSDAVAFVEWPDAAAPELAGRRLRRVRLAHAGGDARTVEVE